MNQYTSVPSVLSLAHHPTPLGCYRAPVWVSRVTRQIPIGCLFYVWYACFHATLSMHPTLSFLPYSHRVCTSVLFVCVSIATLKIFISVIFQIPYICVSIWYLFFSFWLNSLCIIGSSTLLEPTQMCSFCWLGNIPLYVYHSYFIHSFVDGRLGCFHVLAIRNSAAMNIGVHMSFSILVASGYMPRSGIAGSYGAMVLLFLVF